MRSAEAIKHAFEDYSATYRLSLPIECLRRSAGAFEQNGRETKYRFGVDDGIEFLECYATNRMTNDRLYRVYGDGRVGRTASACAQLLDSRRPTDLAHPNFERA